MENNLLVILALFSTSIIVRVLPSLISIEFNKKTQYIIEEILPTSIFICFITYIVMSEITIDPTKSVFAFTTLIMLSIVLKLGLIATTFIASIMYYISF